MQTPSEEPYFEADSIRADVRDADTEDMFAHQGFGEPPHFISSLLAVARHRSAGVLAELGRGPCRQGDLAERLGCTGGVMAECLRELDSEGLVVRRVDPGPPLRVLYELTPRGTSLASSLNELRDWAQRQA